MINGVFLREEISRLGEKDHHHAHHDARRREVDLARGDVSLFGFRDRWPMRLDEKLDRLADALAEVGGKLGLPLPRGLDGFEEARKLPLVFRDESFRSEERAEGCDLRPRFALFEPERRVGFREGVVVEPGVDDAPLPCVRQKGEPMLGAPQPLDDPGERTASPADADPRLGVDEDGKDGAVRRLPDSPRLYQLPRHRGPRPFVRDRASLEPASGVAPEAMTEAEDVLEDRVEDEGRSFAVLRFEARERAPQLLLGARGERLWGLRKELEDARGGDEESSVVQRGVPGVGVHAS